jgi:hypothetical protein
LRLLLSQDNRAFWCSLLRQRFEHIVCGSSLRQDVKRAPKRRRAQALLQVSGVKWIKAWLHMCAPRKTTGLYTLAISRPI